MNGRATVITQADIEGKLERLDRQMSRLIEQQQTRYKRRFWIGGAALLLGVGYIVAGAYLLVRGLSTAGIPLLLSGLPHTAAKSRGCDQRSPVRSDGVSDGRCPL
jgi:hypothetical protein